MDPGLPPAGPRAEQSSGPTLRNDCGAVASRLTGLAIGVRLDNHACTSHHCVMEPTYPDGVATDPLAVPGLAPPPEGDRGPALALDVDGEMFELRPDDHGGTSYAWLTGPNNGYGFGTTPTSDWSTDQHRRNIRGFLAQVDPETGFIED